MCVEGKEGEEEKWNDFSKKKKSSKVISVRFGKKQSDRRLNG